ncbi:MAG: hypothetical protein QOJ50_1440 [Cryptosporangiaceae bacterium]|nr:hypothetical protein [Cryptosporangiaceae bacterium]
MKIAMVSEHASPLSSPWARNGGGQVVQVAELASALASDGHDVTVYTRRDAPDLPDTLVDSQGYRIEHVEAGPAEYIPRDDVLPHLAEFGRHLGAAITENRPDIVHAHYWLSGMVSLAAAQDRRIPVVQTFHGLGGPKRRILRGNDTSPPGRIRMEQVIARSVSHVIATTTEQLGDLIRLGVPRRRVTVVPCGVDTVRFNPSGPAAGDGRVPRVVSVGRFGESKGFDVLIQALRRVPDAELVVGGGGDGDAEADIAEGKRLTDIADRCGVGHRLSMIGPVARTEMPGLLRSASVVASLPAYEPFGMVPLEAMACGVPVLASAVGGHLDTVVDGVTGVLVPPGRPDLTGTVLKELLGDPVQLDAYGVAGADRARSRYSWERVAGATIRLYRDVLGIPRPAAAEAIG